MKIYPPLARLFKRLDIALFKSRFVSVIAGSGMALASATLIVSQKSPLLGGLGIVLGGLGLYKIYIGLYEKAYARILSEFQKPPLASQSQNIPLKFLTTLHSFSAQPFPDPESPQQTLFIELAKQQSNVGNSPHWTN